MCFTNRLLSIDIESLQNRLLKVCYVPATSACLHRLLFIIFLLRPLTALIKETRQTISAIKHSIFLRCLCYYLILIIMFVVVVIPWVQILLNYDFVKVLVLFGGGLAPSSQTLGSLVITPWPIRCPETMDSVNPKFDKLRPLPFSCV